jgi:hypothetical protein
VTNGGGFAVYAGGTMLGMPVNSMLMESEVVLPPYGIELMLNGKDETVTPLKPGTITPSESRMVMMALV